MERLTVSLETAKRLQEAGYPQSTIASFRTDGYLVWWPPETPLSPDYAWYAAPTAQELADELPPQTTLIHSDLILRKRSGFGGYEASWQTAQLRERGDTLAEALAALYLKLKEEAPND